MSNLLLSIIKTITQSCKMFTVHGHTLHTAHNSDKTWCNFTALLASWVTQNKLTRGKAWSVSGLQTKHRRNVSVAAQWNAHSVQERASSVYLRHGYYCQSVWTHLFPRSLPCFQFASITTESCCWETFKKNTRLPLADWSARSEWRALPRGARTQRVHSRTRMHAPTSPQQKKTPKPFP